MNYYLNKNTVVTWKNELEIEHVQGLNKNVDI